MRPVLQPNAPSRRRLCRRLDVQHLLWLKQQLGTDLRDMVVINTGGRAYRRSDGVAVVPAALLGP